MISLTNQIVTALLIISNNFPSLNSQSCQELPLCLLYWSRPPASLGSLSKIIYRRTSQQNLATFQSMQYAHLTRQKTNYTPALPPVPPVSGPAIQLMKLSHTVNCFLSSVRFLLRKLLLFNSCSLEAALPNFCSFNLLSLQPRSHWICLLFPVLLLLWPHFIF